MNIWFIFIILWCATFKMILWTIFKNDVTISWWTLTTSLLFSRRPTGPGRSTGKIWQKKNNLNKWCCYNTHWYKWSTKLTRTTVDTKWNYIVCANLIEKRECYCACSGKRGFWLGVSWGESLHISPKKLLGLPFHTCTKLAITVPYLMFSYLLCLALWVSVSDDGSKNNVPIYRATHVVCGSHPRVKDGCHTELHC